MEKIEQASFDAGPLIHLSEVCQLSLLALVDEKIISKEVYKEYKKHGKGDLEVEITSLTADAKEYSRYLMNEYHIDLGEAQAIALAKQEDTKYFFTDDWEAREVSEALGLKAHGTLGIVIRAYRESVLDKSEAEDTVEELYQNSSLFITSRIVKKAKSKVDEFQDES